MFNLSYKDSLSETEQAIKENAPSVRSRNQDSKSCDDGGAGDIEVSAVPKISTSKSNQKKVIYMSTVSRLSAPRSYRPNGLKDLTQVWSYFLFEIVILGKYLCNFNYTELYNI